MLDHQGTGARTRGRFGVSYLSLASANHATDLAQRYLDELAVLRERSEEAYIVDLEGRLFLILEGTEMASWLYYAWNVLRQRIRLAMRFIDRYLDELQREISLNSPATTARSFYGEGFGFQSDTEVLRLYLTTPNLDATLLPNLLERNLSNRAIESIDLRQAWPLPDEWRQVFEDARAGMSSSLRSPTPSAIPASASQRRSESEPPVLPPITEEERSRVDSVGATPPPPQPPTTTGRQPRSSHTAFTKGLAARPRSSLMFGSVPAQAVERSERTSCTRTQECSLISPAPRPRLSLVYAP